MQLHIVITYARFSYNTGYINLFYGNAVYPIHNIKMTFLFSPPPPPMIDYNLLCATVQKLCT